MLRAAKRSQEVFTPLGVELIERTGHRPERDVAGPAPDPDSGLGSMVDTYA